MEFKQLIQQYQQIMVFICCLEMVPSYMYYNGDTKLCVLNYICKLPCKLTQSYNNTRVDVLWFNGRNEMLTQGYEMVKYNSIMKVNKPGFGEFELQILRLTRRFADTYSCKTTDGRTLSIITVVLEHKPKINEELSSPVHVIVQENSLVELNCIISGLPKPEIVWYRGSSQSEIEGIKGHQLKISRVPRYASDNYTCIAKNAHGVTDRLIKLTVQFGPEVRVMESSIQAVPGGEVIMGCAVQGSPLKNVFWTNNKGKIITTDWKYEVSEENDDNFPLRFLKLRIKPNIISVHDSGTYTCHAKGENTESEKTVLLEVVTL